MSTQNNSNHISSAVIGGGVTVLLVIGAAAILVWNWLQSARGYNIEDAPNPSLMLPLVCAGLLLISAAWWWWLHRRFGWRHLATVVATVITALLLIIVPVISWQAATSSRDLTVISMTCDARAENNAKCSENAVDTIVLLQGADTDWVRAPDMAIGNLTREFHDLPNGRWKTRLAVDGPAETVAVSAFTDKDGSSVQLADLRPALDAESGRMRWSALIPVDTDVSTIRVQFYLSDQPVVESAQIRFDMRECAGQNVRTFDATQCSPIAVSSSVVVEKSPQSARTWRQPLVQRQESSIVITNLEARTYDLQADYAAIQMISQSTDVLIIPAAMDQTEQNSLVSPGEEAFAVEINANTGELVYVVYVFPAGPTFANTSSHSE